MNATATALRPLTHYVSVLPRNARAGDTIELGRRIDALRADGISITKRSLLNSGIVYVFTTARSAREAMDRVSALVEDGLATVVECRPAADGATRVAIDPALIAEQEA